jgi:hypothetical protein
MTADQLTTSSTSTGPRTPAGKRRASFNAFRHGLTSKVHVHTPEESEAFRAHCQGYHAELAPVGIQESDLVQLIAEDRWRLKRARSIESNIFAAGINAHAGETESGNEEIDNALAEGKTWIEQSKFLALITLYEQRINRAIEKNSSALRALQTARREAYKQAQQEAINLMHEAQFRGEEYEPQDDFLPASAHGHFVYSPTEIERTLDRRDRIWKGIQAVPRMEIRLPGYDEQEIDHRDAA